MLAHSLLPGADCCFKLFFTFTEAITAGCQLQLHCCLCLWLAKVDCWFIEFLSVISLPFVIVTARCATTAVANTIATADGVISCLLFAAIDFHKSPDTIAITIANLSVAIANLSTISISFTVAITIAFIITITVTVAHRHHRSPPSSLAAIIARHHHRSPSPAVTIAVAITVTIAVAVAIMIATS